MVKDPQYKSLVDKHEKMKANVNVDLTTHDQRHCESKWAKHAMQEILRRTRTQNDNLGGLLNSVMMAELKKTMDVTEVYNPPRVVDMDRKLGLRAGWSLDLTTIDEERRPWDFNKVHMRNKAVRKLLNDKPRFLIGSPMCAAFCSFNNMNHKKMNPEEMKRRVQYGKNHLDFLCKIVRIAMEGRPIFAARTSKQQHHGTKNA